jgi:DNA repair protein RecO (recombination protein O)
VAPPGLVTQAVVVRLVDYSEADRIATLLTKDVGKLAALARGARRSQRRFGSLTLFALGEATLRRGRGELWGLDHFSAARDFPHIARDVARMAHAAYVCELGRELVPLEAHDVETFTLVTTALAEIDGAGYGAAELRRFELQLLGAVGLAPSLDRCVGCGAPADDAREQTFDARRGGLLCASCDQGRGRAVPATVRQALLRAQQGEPMPALTPAEMAVARDLLQALLGEHLNKPLRSLEFILKLNAAGSPG